MLAVVATMVLVSSFNEVSAETGQKKFNGLTIALDSLRSTDTPQVIINFMKQYHYNALRIYMGWCSSFWTGNVNYPMNTATRNYIDELCKLCAQNNFMVVCAVSAQVTPFEVAFPSEIQVGPNGEQNSQGNWVCPTGPNFQTFTKNLIKILTRIMEKYATPRISVDEIVFVTGGGRPTFYSQSMKALYRQRTGKNIPTFTSTSGSYNSEQRQFIEFAKGTIREFYEMMEETARAENPSVLFGALLDTYWVYPKTSNDTQPYDYYATVDEIVYEWFYAIRDGNWAGITDGLQRIKNLNPSAKHYFIYGTLTMTSITNMRKSVELAMAEDYDGVFLYEYAKSKSNPFDVSNIVPSEASTSPGWLYRKSITINHMLVSADLVNFPVLIDITDSDLASHAQLDGDDIYFTDSSGTQLSHEIELYNAGHLVAWVKVPSLSASEDTVLYMFYGNAVAGNQEDPSGVWDANFMMVQHLNETSGTHYDSTINGNNGTPNGVNQNAAGKIDGADDFDGTNDYISVPHSSKITGFTQAFTASFWIKMDSVTGRRTILNKWNTNSQRAWYIDYDSSRTNTQLGLFASQDGTSYRYWYAPFSPVAGNWYHIAIVWRSGQQALLYVNGAPVTATTTTAITSIYNNALEPLYIGRSYTSGRYFDGVIDEVCLSNVARSAQWINTSYNNQMR